MFLIFCCHTMSCKQTIEKTVHLMTPEVQNFEKKYYGCQSKIQEIAYFCSGLNCMISVSYFLK